MESLFHSFRLSLSRSAARGPFVLAVPVPILEMAKLTLANLDRKTIYWKDIDGAATSRKAQNQTETDLCTRGIGSHSGATLTRGVTTAGERTGGLSTTPVIGCGSIFISKFKKC